MPVLYMKIYLFVLIYFKYAYHTWPSMKIYQAIKEKMLVYLDSCDLLP